MGLVSYGLKKYKAQVAGKRWGNGIEGEKNVKLILEVMLKGSARFLTA